MRRNTFKHLPLLGCIRDRSGRIIAVTDLLLRREQLRERDVIGQRVSEIWPAGAEWLNLDREALRQKKPIVRLEPASSGWIRSTRVPTGRRVEWYGLDVTEQVRLAQQEALFQATLVAPDLRAGDERIAEALLQHGSNLSAVAASTGIMPIESLSLLMGIKPLRLPRRA